MGVPFHAPLPPNDKRILVILFSIAFTAVFFWGLAIRKAHAEELTASWYSIESLKKEGTWKFSKGVMSNGETFDDNAYTCATRLYPLGSILRVTALGTKKALSVRVRVTDRIGKRFAKKRIDLSKTAFRQIAHLKQGIIQVKVERIG